MNNQKNNNSVLFLATLGVYIGLLMAGASPGAIAQGKVTSRYECELKHLVFDERPGDVDPLSYDLARRFIELTEATKVRLEIVMVNEPSEHGYPFFFRHVDFASYIGRDGKVIDDEWDSSSSKWASASHAGQMVDLHALFLTALADCTDPTSKKVIQTSAEFTMDADVVGLELILRKASNERAFSLATELENHFRVKAAGQDLRQTVVYSNTSVVSNGNQVFIVTRLPRAGLDALIANDAK